MCDYSLEMYQSRAAREGEIYVTTRFPSGSIGLAAPEECETAVCMSCGTRLMLESLSAETQMAFKVNDVEEVTFIHLEEGLHRDGVQFANGCRTPLHRLGVGVLVSLADIVKPAIRKELASERIVEVEPAE